MSERYIFKKIAEDDSFGSVLDVGCAAGGLALALSDYASVKSYTGVDINEQAISVANNHSWNLPTEFYNSDILTCEPVSSRVYDLVCCLSVADWNIETNNIINRCWSHVAPGGHMVISLRLTPGEGVRDMERSYQYIQFSDGPVAADAERAPYVVMNVREAVGILSGLRVEPTLIHGYGYWGKPSAMARTPFDRLIFTVFAVRKPRQDEAADETCLQLHLPASGILGG